MSDPGLAVPASAISAGEVGENKDAPESFVPPIMIAVLVAAATIAAVAAWLLWDATSTLRGLTFISKPEFVIWLMILCAQAAVWTLALFPVLHIVYQQADQLWSEGILRGRAIVSLVVGAIVITALAVVFSLPSGFLPAHTVFGKLSIALNQLPDQHQWPLPHHVLKITVLTLFGFVVGLTAVVGIWLAGLDLRHISRQAAPRADDLARIMRRRDELNILLSIIGVIIGLGTLATGALRNAVLAANLGLKFPSTYVLVFGLYYSGLLALAYTPSWAALRAAATQLRDHETPIPSPSDANFSDAYERRQKLDDLLQLGLSASATFKSGVAILTPLAGSLVSLLIGKK